MFTFLTPPPLPVLKESSCKVIKERQLKATASRVSEQLLYIALQEPADKTKPQFSCWTYFLIEEYIDITLLVEWNSPCHSVVGTCDVFKNPHRTHIVHT